MQKKIVINALCVGEKLSGLGRVGLEIITEIFNQGIESRFLIIVNKGALQHFDQLDTKNIVVVNKYCSSDYGIWGHLLRTIYSNLISLRYHGHKLWALSQIEASVFGVNQYVIIHDVIPLIMPEHSSKLYYFFKYYLHFALSRSRMILTDSEYSKKRIMEFYPKVQAPVNVVYLGDSNKFEKIKNDKEDTVLYTGRYSPTKNTEGLLQAFISYRKAEGLLRLRLCGVAFSDILVETQVKVENLIETGVLIFEGYVSEQKLKALYLSSKGLILPSFEEGFGLTVLEGIAHGCLVACSNQSSIPEVAGDLAFYFNPNSRDEIMASLFQIEKSQKYYDETYHLKCEKHLKKFNWKDALNNYLNCLRY